MIGRTISHYRILDKLGEGGMGEVYLAEDTKLKRKVALKFLPRRMTADADARARFAREAQAAAALNHPNIITIHEIGEHDGQVFIAMEYIEGQTLKEIISDYPTSSTLRPMPISQVLEIASQIASGLAAAHARGIVHRDLKPANIFVTRDNRVKILDFGIAKLANSETRLTKTGSTVGTVAYMSPEQAMGREVDARTDIWSLGVILYEMLAGRLPFRGDYEQAVVYSILNEAPASLEDRRPEVPSESRTIVSKCLEKNPEVRYRHMEDLIADVRRMKGGSRIARKPARGGVKRKSGRWMKWGAAAALVLAAGLAGFQLAHRSAAGPGTRRTPSIAVLPFVDMSPQGDQEYFCDGMTEELINRLCNLRGLKVTARTSAFAFKGKAEDVREIGKKLDVQHILEGSIQKEANRLRITVQLINTTDSFHLWSETFDRELTKVFDIQDEIALAVADKLKFTLLAEDKARLARHSTDNQEAYQAYLQGRYFLGRETLLWNKGREYLLRAIELDPRYAPAYAGLADYFTYAGEAGGNPQEMIPQAREAALQALKIDENLVEARLAMGRIKLYFDWDWSGAEAEFGRAVRNKPNYAPAYLEYAYFLRIMKRYPEALGKAEKGMELDPLSPWGACATGDVLRCMRRYDRAQSLFDKALELNPDNDATHWSLWLMSVERRKGDETQRETEKLMEIGGYPGWRASPEEKEEFLRVSRKDGWKGGLRWNLGRMMRRAETEYVSPYLIAMFHAVLGNRDESIIWLEKGYEQRDMLMPYLHSHPLLDPIRDDPRFQAISAKMGFGK